MSFDNFLNKLKKDKCEYFLHIFKSNKHNKYLIKDELSSYITFEKVIKKFKLNYTFTPDINIGYFDINNSKNIIYIESKECYKEIYGNTKKYHSNKSKYRKIIFNIIGKIKNYFIFPISIPGHLTFMLYVKKNNGFYFFDSSGYTEETEFYDEIYDIFGEFTTIHKCYELQKYDYVEFIEKNNVIAENGYCVEWCSMLIYCYIKYNNKYTPEDLVNKIVSSCGDKHETLNNIIKNFSLFVHNDFSLENKTFQPNNYIIL